jgi:hypothetical protein
MDISQAIAVLSNERPVFSSEADFQHALAWQLQLQDPLAKIRLEHRPQAARMYLDIVIESQNKRTAIELKYKTRKLETTVGGESFWLANHGAQDCGKYDVIKDIERLEQVVDGEDFHEGFMIFLTNDPHYYTSREDSRLTIDQQFRLTQGRILHGKLEWGEAAGPGTIKGREEPIQLTAQYPVNWMKYSNVNVPYEEFQMIILPVKPTSRGDSIDIDSTLSQLAEQRPIFESQSDFRDALAHQLKSQGWGVSTNRELGTGMKADIWAEAPEKDNVVIEVRYKTSKLACTHNGNTFMLKNQAAQDISRYDYLKDVQKLEQIVNSRPGTKGYSIMITNDHLYWNKPTKQRSVDEDFLLYNGKTVSGNLKWSNDAGFGTTSGRTDPIYLGSEYSVKWQDYFNLPGYKNGLFKALCLSIEA